MLKIPSLDVVSPSPNIVTINEVFRDFLELIDKKFKNIDICPTKKSKTPWCPHKKSCVHNLIINLVKGFFKSFGV